MKKTMVAIGICLMSIVIFFSGCVSVPEEFTQFSIMSFDIEPSIINQGEYANLSWVVISGNSVLIDNGIGNVALTGHRMIQPTQTTTYTLTATNATLTKSATATVTVKTMIQNQNNTLINGLVGYWNFNEGKGHILHDSSFYENDGIIYGSPTWTSGISGYAISFDGIDDWVDCGNDASLNPTTAITLAAWYKPTTSWYGAGNDPIIDKPYDAGISRRYQYHLGICGDLYAANRPLSIMYDVDTAGTLESINAPPHSLVFNQWSFIVGTYDGTIMKLYVDGVLKSSKTVYGGITAYDQNLRIAKYIGNNGETFLPGIIDEIRIYNRALTANEVQDLFTL